MSLSAASTSFKPILACPLILASSRLRIFVRFTPNFSQRTADFTKSVSHTIQRWEHLKNFRRVSAPPKNWPKRPYRSENFTSMPSVRPTIRAKSQTGSLFRYVGPKTTSHDCVINLTRFSATARFQTRL